MWLITKKNVPYLRVFKLPEAPMARMVRYYRVNQGGLNGPYDGGRDRDRGDDRGRDLDRDRGRGDDRDRDRDHDRDHGNDRDRSGGHDDP